MNAVTGAPPPSSLTTFALAVWPGAARTYQFAAQEQDGAALLTSLGAIADAIRLHDPSLSFWPSAERSIHDNVVAFLDVLTTAARGAAVGSRAIRTIRAKAREHIAYLEEKSAFHGANSPREWRDGVVFSGAVVPQAEPIATARIILATIVREHVEHFYGLCVVEDPCGYDAIGSDENIAVAIAGGSSHAQAISGKGDLPRFVTRIDGDAARPDGDPVVFRFPLDTATIWDPDFATIMAATVEIDHPEWIDTVELGIGDDNGVAYCASRPGAVFVSIVTAWRFRKPPPNPYLQVKLVTLATATPIVVTMSRLFAGHDYDPYVFNPLFAVIAAENGRPELGANAAILADFEREARLRCKSGAYFGNQAFVRPYLVTREGEPRFPMLVGTVNSVHWYGAEPKHNLEDYVDWGCACEGDVVMDCGAHAGQTAVYFARIAGPRGRVIAFDPFAQNTLQVEAQAALNNASIRVVQAGVGKTHEMFVVSNCDQQTIAAASPADDDKAVIEIVPLDDFINEAPTLIKIDIEGAEVEALIGATDMLRRHQPKLLIEVHTAMIEQFGRALSDLFAHIPGDLYDIYFLEQAGQHDWVRYSSGLEEGVSTPLFVLAFPKSITGVPGWVPPHAGVERVGSPARIIKAREAEIQSIGCLLLEREETILMLEEVIKRREAERDHRSALILDREATIATLQDIIAAREDELDKRAALIFEREASISSLQHVVADREIELDKRAALVLEREGSIAGLQGTIAAYEAELDKRAALVREREATILRLEELVRQLRLTD